MDLMGEIGGILRQYAGTPQPTANTTTDFEKVVPTVSKADLADGVAHAMNSDETPPFGQLVASMFGQANDAQKASMLNQLIAAIGPETAAKMLSGTGLAAALSTGNQVAPEQAQAISPTTVQQMAERAHSANGSIVDMLSSYYAEHPQLVKALGAGALALVMSRISKRNA